MEIKELQKPLPIESIDFRVQSINKGGYATILAYKDARIDMQRLDDVVGALNWKREHTRDNHNCIVSIWNDATKQWISKEDTGTESNTEKEKGLASDSFKRACFNWGIGRELYDYPIIQIKLNANEFKIENYGGKEVVKPTFDFKLKEWKWTSKFEDNKIVSLIAKDQNNQLRYSFGTQTPPKEQPKAKPSLSNERFDAAFKAVEDGKLTKQDLAVKMEEFQLTGTQKINLKNFLEDGQ